MRSDALFFTKEVAAGDDLLISVSGLSRSAGIVSLASQSGYSSVDTGDPGLNAGVIDAKYVSGTPLVALGGNYVHVFDGANIATRIGVKWDPDGSPIAGVDALAIGSFGALGDRIVIARETTPGANDVLIMSTDAMNPGGNVSVAGGPAPNGTAHGLALGDFQPATPGVEALIGFTDAAVAGGNGHQLFYTATGSSGQHFINRTISDVAAGDLTGSGNIDYVLTGLSNVGGSGFGQGSRIYEANGAAGNLKSSPAISGPHNPPQFNAVAIGNLDDDPDNEIVLVGNFVRVLDNNGTGSFDLLPALYQSSSLADAKFVDVAIADADGDGVNEVVTVADNGLVYLYGHAAVGDAGSAFQSGPLGVYDTGAGALLGIASLTRTPGPASVAARYVFYNNSKFDGNSDGANPADDNAIATDKTPLLPSEHSTFQNYTSYVQGINGVMIDVDGLVNPAGLSLADFDFRVGNAHDSFPWTAAPAPVNSIATSIRPGEGEGGSDRITLIWEPGAITKEWLQVTVKATANTGLLFDDVFYIGNAIGETGNSSDVRVSTDDIDATIANPRGPFNQASIQDVYDYNRDGLVGAGDVVIVRDNLTGDPIGIGELTAPLPTSSPIQIVENGSGQWLRFEESVGAGWNFNHATAPDLGITSAVDISADGSPLHLYLSENPGGMRLYLWEAGRDVPNMPHTGVKPTVAVWGNILAGDIYAIEDNPMTLFMRQQKHLSASASTAFFSASQGINSDVDGGAGIVMHPDHHQDLATYAGDPLNHPLSGNLTLAAYGQGNGAQANAILFQTRSGPNQVADRMMIKDGTVNVYGNLTAFGTITSGSSRDYKDDIHSLSPELAASRIAALTPVSFAYSNDPTQVRLGFIAEDVPAVFGTADRKGVDLMSVVSALTLVVQQQRTQIDSLRGLLEPFVVQQGLSFDVGSTNWDLPEVGTGHAAGDSSSQSESPSGFVEDLAMRSLTSTANPTANITFTQSLATPLANQSADVGNAELTAISGTGSQALFGGTGSNSAASLPRVSPFKIVEDMNHQWLRLQEQNGRSWTFNHTSSPAMGIDSALDISPGGSPLDWYLADTPDGMQMYLWDDGHFIPNLSQTGEKPDLAIWGDILSGDISTFGRDPISMFLRDETALSASAATVLFSANTGINSEVDGGAGIVIRPDHHQDLEVFPNDPASHYQSGSLQLIAYGKGSGAEANAIVFKTRSDADELATRMIVKDGTATVFGNIVATGSVIPGSSREFKQDIAQLSIQRAQQLIDDLASVSFVYTADEAQQRLGFIAEDVPEEFGTSDRKGVDAMSIISALTLVVQQQQGEIERIADLYHTLQVGSRETFSGVDGGGDLMFETTLASLANELAAGRPAASHERQVMEAADAYLKNSTKDGVITSTNVDGTSAQLAPSATTNAQASFAGGGAGEPTTFKTTVPFKIVESANVWLRLESSNGNGWNFQHFSDPTLGINSALSLGIDGAPRDLYLADEADGMRLYLWDDGLEVPNLPQSGVKPTLAVSGDMLLGDIITIGREQISMFLRTETDLSADATTNFYSARDGIISETNGGAGIMMHPDHHQDQETFPNNPLNHNLSGSLQLVAYGKGNGSQANSILLQTRGSGNLVDRMVIKDGTVAVYGNVVATGSIITGSSRDYKQNIQVLSPGAANELIARLSSVSFAYHADPLQSRLGFVAEDVPGIVGTVDQKGVDPMGITAALTLVVQQQQAYVGQLFAQIAPWVAAQNVKPSPGSHVDVGKSAKIAAFGSLLSIARDGWLGMASEIDPTRSFGSRFDKMDSSIASSRSSSRLELLSVFRDWQYREAADDCSAFVYCRQFDDSLSEQCASSEDDAFASWPNKFQVLQLRFGGR